MIVRSPQGRGKQPVVSTAGCIDLQASFGKRFKLGYEASYNAERGEHARTPDPWLRILLCRHGHIYPYGGTKLAACTNLRGPVARALAKLPCCYVHQNAVDGVTVLFDVADFPQVATLLKPRRKRQLSAEQAARLVEAGRLYRFSAGAQVAGRGLILRDRPSDEESAKEDAGSVLAPTIPVCEAV